MHATPRRRCSARLDHFDRAIARDPDLALAHATLAMVHAELAEMGVFDPASRLPARRAAVPIALRLDPELDVAHCTLAFLKACARLRLGRRRSRSSSARSS